MSSNTDTGLVTVAKVDSRLGDMSRLSIIDRPLSIGTEVCLRSQAEELLAAERAEKEELDAECRVLAKRCIEKDAQIKELRDTSKQMIGNWRNRAETAEAKLETYHEEYENRKEGYEKTIDSLEAKLAAAEKDAATWEANFKALNAKTARAALEKKD